MQSCLAEASNYHDPQANGFFSVLINSHQRSYRLRELPCVLESLPSEADVFLSQSSFYKPNRCLVCLKSLGTAFSDCETHKTRYCSMTPEQQAIALVTHCEDNGVPRPTLVNHSGRGLHPKWAFDVAVPGKALPRWNAVQKEICTFLQPFGADKGARDGSRCLRVVGSVNPRSHQVVRTVWESGTRYDFDALSREILPIPREQIHANKRARQDRQKTAGTAANLWTPQTLWWNRLADIRKLINLRGWHNGVPVGHRNNFLLVAACAAAWGADATDLPSEINALANEFCSTLTANEVRCHVQYTIREVQAGRRRRFTSERIIELLEIGVEEQIRMQTLVNNDLRAEYKRMANRKHSDRATYLALPQQRREQARTLRTQGLTYRQIAERMNTTPDAVDKLLRKPVLPKS